MLLEICVDFPLSLGETLITEFHLDGCNCLICKIIDLFHNSNAHQQDCEYPYCAGEFRTVDIHLANCKCFICGVYVCYDRESRRGGVDDIWMSGRAGAT